jgi:hypothetical protein
MIASFDQIDARTLDRYRQDPAAFIEECLISPYDERPYHLIPTERAFINYAFTRDAEGRLLYPLMIYGAIKKSRKTELAGMLTPTMILLFGGKYAEGFIVANDQEQAINRCFTACRRIVDASPLLRHEAECTSDKIFFPATQSTIRAIAADYTGIAGGHPTISVHDELWGATSERSRRLWDELVPVPSRTISCRLVTTHAGFEGEGTLLHELYQRGMQLPLVGPDLRAGEGMLMLWSHEPLHHWQDDRWLAQMRRELRPTQFARMCENRFVTAESSFVTPELWDNIVDPLLGHKVHDPALATWGAVDASTKHDSTGLALVSWSQPYQRVELCDHHIFTPQPNAPIDFSNDIERSILDWKQRFDLREVWYDPHQMAASAQRLVKAGVNMVEFPQTTDRLTAMGENLFGLIKGRNLLAYPDEQIRTAVLRAVAQEGSRGWKIDKVKQRHHIDIVVALGMAALACVRGQSKPGYDESYRAFQPDFVDEDAPQRAAAAQPQSPAPVQCNGDWWRSMPRSPIYASTTDADAQLCKLYEGIEAAQKWGRGI